MFDLRPLPFGGKLIKSPCSGNFGEGQFIFVMSVEYRARSHHTGTAGREAVIWITDDVPTVARRMRASRSTFPNRVDGSEDVSRFGSEEPGVPAVREFARGFA